MSVMSLVHCIVAVTVQIFQCWILFCPFFQLYDGDSLLGALMVSFSVTFWSFYFPLTALTCFLCLCGPQIRGVQGETSAIFEKGGLQPQERHPLHAMFRTDGGQPEGAHRVLPLVHVSAPVLAEPNLFIIPSCLLLFLFINY